MNFELHEYWEIFEPSKKVFFPVRVIDLDSDGIICHFLNSKKNRKIYNYSLATHGYIKPSISDELLISCGFEQNNIEFIKENKIVIKCLVGELKESIFPYYADFNYNIFGYKFLKNKEELTNIIEILRITNVDKSSLAFMQENQSTFRIEKLRDYLNIDNENFDDLYLQSRSI